MVKPRILRIGHFPISQLGRITERIHADEHPIAIGLRGVVEREICSVFVHFWQRCTASWRFASAAA